MSEHQYLKTLPSFFRDIESGIKTFEVRFNDRNYQAGDILHLQEFIPQTTYTGREITKEVTYVLSAPQYCKDGYVVLGIKAVPRQLTLDELRKMDGQPVWVAYKDYCACQLVDGDKMRDKLGQPTAISFSDYINAGFQFYDRPPGGEGR